MSTELLMILFTALGAFLGKLVDWIFNKRKFRAEAAGTELNNATKIHEIYAGLMDDLGKRYEEKYQQITRLYEDKIKLLNDEIGFLHRNIKVLKSENTELRRRVKELEKNK